MDDHQRWTITCPRCEVTYDKSDDARHDCVADISELCKCAERGAIIHNEVSVTHFGDCEWLYHPMGGNLNSPQQAIDVLDAHIKKRYPKTNFTCPHCKKTSNNPHDRKENYCGNCHEWIS